MRQIAVVFAVCSVLCSAPFSGFSLEWHISILELTRPERALLRMHDAGYLVVMALSCGIRSLSSVYGKEKVHTHLILVLPQVKCHGDAVSI